MAGGIRKCRMKKVTVSEAQDDVSYLLRQAAKQDIVITRHGKPAGLVDWI
jgi:prevent-host-death family protein